MKQIYTPWWTWEDYQAGMWRKLPKEQESEFLQKAIEFTGDHVLYGNAMGEVIDIWTFTMLNSLSDPSKNKRAFLGHCACQYAINCPEYIVRQAWYKLTQQQRDLADQKAQYHIDKWLEKYKITSKSGSENVIMTVCPMIAQMK